MPYDVKCRTCGVNTHARDVVDLFKNHTNAQGRFVCSNSKCGGTDTFIYKKSPIQENADELFERWYKGVIQIHYKDNPIYCPYIFLAADNEAGPITGLHFDYYKDMRPKGGRLKHGAGPGGAPILDIDDIFTILRRLLAEGLISKKHLQQCADAN
jgi:hypothetical protein